MGLIPIPVHSILWQRGAGGPLDQRSSALGFTGVSARAQSHLTCSSAHNVHLNNRSAPPDAPAWPQIGPKIDSGPRTESDGRAENR
jgi:hypothetical protein